MRGMWLTLRAALAAAMLCAVVTPATAERAASDVRGFQAGMLDAGITHGCLILDDATLRCWGDGGSGKLGTNAVADVGDSPAASILATGPVKLPAGRTAVAVSAGGSHTCAILDDGSARCWGLGANGRLGYGNTTSVGDGVGPSIAAAGPVPLPAGRTARAITAGAEHTCAILDTGRLYCWGRNHRGQLGYGNTTDVGDGLGPSIIAAGPVPLPAGRTARAVAAGWYHTCAILDDGALACWGEGMFGKLGYNGTANVGDGVGPSIAAAGPVPLPAGRTAVAVSAAAAHTCAVLDDGTLRCWGAGNYGRLGHDNTANIGDGIGPSIIAAGPVPLPAGRTAQTIAVGNVFTCAVLDSGALHCWGGSPSGQLGYNGTANVGDGLGLSIIAAGPVPLPAGRTARTVAAGLEYTCAALDDATVRCWGDGADGRLGYNTTTDVGNGVGPSIITAGAVNLGRAAVDRVADLSLAIDGHAASVATGGTLTVVVRLANTGPDALPGSSVALDVDGGLTVAGTPSTGTFDATTGRWTPGSIAAGASASIALTLRAGAPGRLDVVGELTASPLPDPDSRPGNLVVGEDDRAVAAITVTQAPPVAADRITIRLGPRRDRTAPHRFVAAGRLVAPGVAAITGCTGFVTLTGRAGSRVLATRTVRLRLIEGACEYSGVLTVTAARRRTARTMAVTARFAGNALLLPRSSIRVTARLT